MNDCLPARIWRVTLLYAAIVVLPLSSCATAPSATAKNIQPQAIVTTAFIHQNNLWVARRGTAPKPITQLALPASAWSQIFWSPDTTQVAATFTDTAALDVPMSLVIANALTDTTAITSHAVAAQQHLAGWIAAGWLLLVGGGAMPGLRALDLSSGASTTITTAPVAAFALAAGAVWFVGAQQTPGTGALLSRWDAGTQIATTVAWLPGFAVAADGAACGRIQLTADSTLILFDSLFDMAGLPCPRRTGAQMMVIDSGMAWPVFGSLSSPASDAFRDFLLDPAGQWAAALDHAPGNALAVAVMPTNATAPPTTLPAVTLPLSSGAALTLTTTANTVAVVAPNPQADGMTTLALIPSDGTAASVTTLAGTAVAVAPMASTSVTAGTDAITCPTAAPPDDQSAARIAIIGDSLTQGYGTTTPTQCSFAAQLGGLRSPLTFGRPAALLIRGMGGFRADQMLTAVPDIAAFAPDIVVVELGTNDERESWPLDQTHAAYDTILATAQQAIGSRMSHPIIACLSIWPSPDFDAPTQLDPYNALIAQECARFGGTYINIAPLATAGMDDSATAPDFNWHPDDRGALNLARLILNALNTTGSQLHG